MIYLLSDILNFFIYRVGRYRVNVVRQNLREAFPEKSNEELKKIERDFYRNFSDYILESLKLTSISDKDAKRRMQFENIELMNKYITENRSIVVYFAHTFNWEWAPSVTLHTCKGPEGQNVEFGQVYRPLKSKFFDHLMLKLRSRFHSVGYPKANTFRCLLKARKEGKITVTGFMSDQHPSHGDPGHYTEFLNHPTLFITGTETVARKLKSAAVFWDMSKPKRGHYVITVRPLADDASTMAEGELTENYARMLEQTIRRTPSLWLWTHKRWKYPAKPSENAK